MYQAKSGVKNFSPLVGGGGGESPPKKVAQNEVKHILVLEFLRYDHFLGGVRKVNGPTNKQASKQARLQTSGHHSDQISCSALRDGATKNKFTDAGSSLLRKDGLQKTGFPLFSSDEIP